MSRSGRRGGAGSGNAPGAGLVRVREAYLRQKPNRDAKHQMSSVGRGNVRALWPGHGRLAENLFLHIDSADREKIFSATARHGTFHGQGRRWSLARPGDPVVRAPVIPRQITDTSRFTYQVRALVPTHKADEVV
jgi:Restriction endonuclease NaeI